MNALPEKIGPRSFRVPLNVTRRRSARRMTLRYHPLKDRFELTLPRYCPQSEAIRFVHAKQAWVEDQLDNLPPRTPLRFGYEIPVLGKMRLITPVSDTAPRERSCLYVLATPSRCESVVTDILRTKLLEYATKHAEKVARELGVLRRLKSIELRDPASRWGSCSPDGRIMLSWRLVFAPKKVLDYVITHEVCHLRELNHSDRFWMTVERMFPNHEIQRDWLRDYGQTLYRYGTPKR